MPGASILQDLRYGARVPRWPERAAQWLGAAVGVMQLMLAAMALWGLIAYAVDRRSNHSRSGWRS